MWCQGEIRRKHRLAEIVAVTGGDELVDNGFETGVGGRRVESRVTVPVAVKELQGDWR